MKLAVSQHFLRSGEWQGEAQSCTLSYDARFLRRRKLTTDAGQEFLVDLEHTASLDAGDAFVLEDDQLVQVVPAVESLLEVRGPDLVRLAWHIGNRHTPCQIERDRLLIQRDHVIQGMLEHLGADVREVEAAFQPEGGAYGHGRTHGHDHSHSHSHAH